MITTSQLLNTHFPPTNYTCPTSNIFYRETLDAVEVVIEITTEGEGLARWMHNYELIGWADAATILNWMDNILPLSYYLEVDPGVQD